MIDEKKIVVELRKLADEANIKCGKAMKNGDELKQMLEAGRCAGFATSLKFVETMKNNEWIPCSERLPKMGQDVIVTDMITGEVTIAYLNTLNCFVFEDGRGHEVSAWQPLPEPYERVKECL